MTASRISDRYAAWLAHSGDQAHRGSIPHLAWNLGDGNALDELCSAAADWSQIASGTAPPETINRRRDAANVALSRMTQYLNAPDHRHEWARLTRAMQHTEDELAVLNGIAAQCR